MSASDDYVRSQIIHNARVILCTMKNKSKSLWKSSLVLLKRSSKLPLDIAVGKRAATLKGFACIANVAQWGGCRSDLINQVVHISVVAVPFHTFFVAVMFQLKTC